MGHLFIWPSQGKKIIKDYTDDGKMMLALIICLVLPIPISAGVDEKLSEVNVKTDLSQADQYLMRNFDWISDKFFGIVESFIPDGGSGKAANIEGRKFNKKKQRLNKFVFPLIVGFLLIKSVVLPLALKALAILSGKAVVLSLMSLILAAIVGLRSVAGNGGFGAQNKIDHHVALPLSKYRRKDVLDQLDHMDDVDPYRYYAERRRKR